MKKITSLVELKESILLLELKQAYEIELLKEQFKITYENLKPINLIKNQIGKLIENSDFKGGILNAGLGIAAGFLSKKAVVGSTHNPIKQLLGTLLQIGVTNIVSKNADGIKSGVVDLIGNFLNRKNK